MGDVNVASAVARVPAKRGGRGIREHVSLYNLPLRVIAKTKLSAAAASISFTDFSGIPSGTRHLAVIFNGALTVAGGTLLVQFNGDSGNNYNYQHVAGVGAVASAARTTAAASIECFGVPTGANLFGGGMIVIPHYAGADNHKAVLTMGGAVENSDRKSTR